MFAPGFDSIVCSVLVDLRSVAGRGDGTSTAVAFSEVVVVVSVTKIFVGSWRIAATTNRLGIRAGGGFVTGGAQAKKLPLCQKPFSVDFVSCFWSLAADMAIGIRNG